MGKNLIDAKFGMATYHKYPSGAVYQGVVEAYSKNRPKFIREIDGELWEEIWNEKAQEKGIEYVHNQSRFTKEIRFSDELKEVENKVVELLKLYNHSSLRYNQIIAGPFIEGRKRALDNIIVQ